MEGNKINVDQIQHIAIIMDGNRRWAKIREQPPMFGHQNGCETLLKIVKYAKRIGIKYMTVYAFSKENWGRTKQEVDFLMMLLKNYINQVLMKTREELENVQIKFTGNMEGVDEESKNMIYSVEKETEENKEFQLNICFSYSGRQEIVDAVKQIVLDVQKGNMSVDDIDELMFKKYLYDPISPYPDLIIRTAGEMRLSNFLLWQVGYSEFYSTQKLWPDFSENDLDEAIINFNQRKRNNGK